MEKCKTLWITTPIFVNYPQILVDYLLITSLVSDRITVDILNLSPACENLRGFVAAGFSDLCRKLSTGVDKHVDNTICTIF